MKRLRLFIIMILLLSGSSASFAADGGFTATELMNLIGVIAIVLTLILILVVCLVLLKTFKVVAALLLKDEKVEEPVAATAEVAVESPVEKRTIWQKLLSLRPMSEEKDLEIDHEFDGIKELDNPTPGWFSYLFYATIIFAVMYMLNFHVFKIGKLQEEEYIAEMEAAEAAKEAFLAQSANRVDENTVELSTAADVLSSGQAIYDKNCLACHGDKGQGTVGPNLTDDYWIHGGTVKDIFKTIKYGVPDKGMISWEKQLTPKEIADVSNYIKSLRGTNPPGAKEPQGVEDTGEEVAAESTAEETPMQEQKTS
ncbi:cytochrome C [Pseudoxanthomonas sp. SGD-10]|nr:cytochrome C [Pseudoxanthomonas sp. SGD-10]